MKTALVHDYMLQYGGAERVLEELCNMYPDAPIYTLAYDASATGYAFEGRTIHTSFLQRFPGVKKNPRLYSFLAPLAVEDFDLSKYDLVFSNSYGYAKGIIGDGEQLHICYCHTPLRLAWSSSEETDASRVSKSIPFLKQYKRIWDYQSAQRPTSFISNSQHTASKVKKIYKRDSHVVYPPLNFNNFYISEPKDYFLLVGSMFPYKRFDFVIEVFNKLGLPLKVIGTGPEYRKLKRMAGVNVELLGLVSESDLASYYSNANALIYPHADFSVTALESMASGRPVIGYKKGSASEFIEQGKTGMFFEEHTHESLKETIYAFYDATPFDRKYIRKSATQYDRAEFRKNVKELADKAIEEDKKLILA